MKKQNELRKELKEVYIGTMVNLLFCMKDAELESKEDAEKFFNLLISVATCKKTNNELYDVLNELSDTELESYISKKEFMNVIEPIIEIAKEKMKN